MGRLEDIAARNAQGGYKLRSNLSFGLRSLFLLVILGLLIFTNWALSPEDHRDLAPWAEDAPPAGATPRRGDDGIQLRRVSPPKPAPAAPAASPVP